jgi:hypothetical protein
MNPDRKWFKVTLRIIITTLDPDRISAMLNLTPTKVGKRGQRKGRTSANWEHHFWLLDALSSDDVPFEDQIPLILDQLESHLDDFRRLTTTEGVEADLFLGFSSDNGQGGAYFTPALLRRIADLSLGTTLDLYPPPSEANED